MKRIFLFLLTNIAILAVLSISARILGIDSFLTGNGLNGEKPFFHPDNFTFGQPLRRSDLEAAVQSVPGVKGVEEIKLRVRRRLPALRREAAAPLHRPQPRAR